MSQSAPRNVSDELIPCGLQTHLAMDEHHDIQIPRYAFAAFLERLRTLGIRTSFCVYWGQQTLYLLDFDPAQVPTLPSIAFIIQAVDGTLFQI